LGNAIKRGKRRKRKKGQSWQNEGSLESRGPHGNFALSQQTAQTQLRNPTSYSSKDSNHKTKKGKGRKKKRKRWARCACDEEPCGVRKGEKMPCLRALKANSSKNSEAHRGNADASLCDTRRLRGRRLEELDSSHGKASPSRWSVGIGAGACNPY